MSRLSMAVACASVLLVAGCSSNNNTTTPTAATASVTETFNGTLAQGGSAAYNFNVTADGAITVTLVSLSPQATITMGLGLGVPAVSGCSVTTTQENVKVGTPIQATLPAGSYCLLLYDLGNMTGADAYSLTVQHP